MFARGDFLFTYLNDAPRFDKPILIYWLQAVGYLIFGPTEWAFRLPSATCGALWCYATWHFARHRFGPDVALGALAVAGTALGPMIIGRAATADALLNLLLALTLFDAWRHLEGGGRAPLLRSYLWMGLGVLAKGPIALIVPAAVTLLYCASRGQWRHWVKSVFDPVGWLILIVLVLPWYAYALSLHGQDFIDGFFLRHNVKRFTGTLEGHAGSVGYYVLMLPLLLLPWVGPLFASLAKLRADWQTGLRRFLWLWAAFVLVFFSLSGTKLPHYALYGATPLFLLIAAHLASLRRAPLHLLAPILLLGLFVALPFILDGLAAGEAGNAYYRAQLSRALEAASWPYYALTAAALTGCVVLAMRWRSAVPERLVGAAAVQAAAIVLAVSPFVGDVLQGPIKQAGLLARASGLPAVTWRFTAPSFSVYRQAVTPARAPEPGELALVRLDRKPGEGFETLYEAGGVVLVKRVAE
jgi:4-amino-4-deoxy-L-arabinose transferase-like glycosyltransferase